MEEGINLIDAKGLPLKFRDVKTITKESVLENTEISQDIVEDTFSKIVEMKLLYKVQFEDKAAIEKDYKAAHYVQIELKRMRFYSYAKWMEFAKNVFSLFPNKVVLLLFCERKGQIFFKTVHKYLSELEQDENGKPVGKPLSNESWYNLKNGDKLGHNKKGERLASSEKLCQIWSAIDNSDRNEIIETTEKTLYPVDDYGNYKVRKELESSRYEEWKEKKREKWLNEKNTESKLVFPYSDPGSYNDDDDYY